MTAATQSVSDGLALFNALRPFLLIGGLLFLARLLILALVDVFERGDEALWDASVPLDVDLDEMRGTVFDPQAFRRVSES